jgi:hypothetical protein
LVRIYIQILIRILIRIRIKMSRIRNTAVDRAFDNDCHIVALNSTLLDSKHGFLTTQLPSLLSLFFPSCSNLDVARRRFQATLSLSEKILGQNFIIFVPCCCVVRAHLQLCDYSCRIHKCFKVQALLNQPNLSELGRNTQPQ